MGYYSDLDIEFRERGKNPYIADVLGISYEELLVLEYDFYSEKTQEGLLIIYRIEFDKNSPKKILDKIDRLEEDGVTAYIHPYELNVADYYQQEFESFPSSEYHHDKFKNEIKNLKRLNLLKLEPDTLEKVLKRQIFIGVIGAMETFLSEAFINKVLHDPELFQNFVETHPEFKQRKFELREIYQETSKLEKTVKKVMLDTIYHNLPVVSQMYASTLQEPFPEFSGIYEYVMQRHDLVHRSGKTKSGKLVNTNTEAIVKLIISVSGFVDRVALTYKIK